MATQNIFQPYKPISPSVPRVNEMEKNAMGMDVDKHKIKPFSLKMAT